VEQRELDKTGLDCERFEVLTAVLLRIQVFLDVIIAGLVYPNVLKALCVI
jgi:hypothetical protein